MVITLHTFGRGLGSFEVRCARCPALIPTLVEKEDMPNAIALNSIQFNVAVMVGPALAGRP